ALLRLSIWFGMALAQQLFQLRLALLSSIEALYFAVSRIGTGQAAGEERRGATMARRAADLPMRPVIREDPLKTQNRALSMFTVALMASLLMLVLWFTGSGQNTGQQHIL